MLTSELIEALDERILEALRAKATGETIAFLCEARAWLTNPDQGTVPTAREPERVDRVALLVRGLWLSLV